MYTPRRGIGQLAPGPASTSACGASPCDWTDYIWLSDACQAFLGCADPTNPLYVTATQGLIVGGAQVIGSTVGGAVAATAGGVVSGVSTQTGIPAAVWLIGGIAAAVFLLPMILKAVK